MTAPAILLAPDPETHAKIVAWEQLARVSPKASFGPSVLLTITAELRNARMAAHICGEGLEALREVVNALMTKIERLEGALQALEVENDELAEQLRRAKTENSDLAVQLRVRVRNAIAEINGQIVEVDPAGRWRGDTYCGEQQKPGSLACTRGRGHAGDHIAHGPSVDVVWRRWPQEPAEPPHAGEPGDRAAEVEA